jgi:hypothetical protein
VQIDVIPAGKLILRRKRFRAIIHFFFTLSAQPDDLLILPAFAVYG